MAIFRTETLEIFLCDYKVLYFFIMSFVQEINTEPDFGNVLTW